MRDKSQNIKVKVSFVKDKIYGIGLQNANESLLDYLRLGGMPGRYLFDEELTAKNYISDMYQSILLRDIVKRNNIRDVDRLQRFMQRYIQVAYLLAEKSMIEREFSVLKAVEDQFPKMVISMDMVDLM